MIVTLKCLPTLYLSDDLADGLADRVGAGQPAGGHPVEDRGQVVFGGGQQLVAFAGTFGGQERVAAGDQPFSRVVGVVDLGQILGDRTDSSAAARRRRPARRPAGRAAR